MDHILNNDTIKVKCSVTPELYKKSDETTQPLAVAVTATNFSSRVKAYGEGAIPLLDLKLYPDTCITTIGVMPSFEDRLSEHDLKSVDTVNDRFPFGSKVFGNVNVGLYFSGMYISLTTSLGRQ